MLLQSALSLPHCIGIKDLHKNTKLGVKKSIEKAAKEARLHMVIPLTFSDPRDTNKMMQYLHDKDIQVNFSEVVANKTQTNLMGKSRAFLSGENKYSENKNNIKINNRAIGCESKIYESEHFSTGVAGSKLAKIIFMLSKKEPIWTIKNDLIFVKKEGGKWKVCNDQDNISPNILKITKRDFEIWEKNNFGGAFSENSESEMAAHSRFLHKCKAHNNLKTWIEYCKEKKLTSPPEIKSTQDLASSLLALPKFITNAFQDEIKGAYSKTGFPQKKKLGLVNKPFPRLDAAPLINAKKIQKLKLAIKVLCKMRDFFVHQKNNLSNLFTHFLGYILSRSEHIKLNTLKKSEHSYKTHTPFRKGLPSHAFIKKSESPKSTTNQ
ncbi:MAG: hypothetical protein ACNA7Y_05815 [Gammaproteobacteria bacterium]